MRAAAKGRSGRRLCWTFGLAAWLLAAHAWAQAEDDPALAAALAQCPAAAGFVRLHGKPSAAGAKPETADVPPAEPELRERLLEMARIDQQARSGDWSPAMIRKMAEADAAHLPQIKRIVADHGGLPGVARVGGDGLAAAWLLVQHADADPAFQAGVLAKMGPLVERGEVTAREYALLTDRVLAGQGKPQRYGSQLVAVDGKWTPRPMEAPEQVDQRRAAIGEMPLADYVCVATALFPPPAAAGPD